MSSYFAGSGGGGSPYFGGSHGAAPASHASHGVGGFLHNLGSDVVHSVAGLPAGIVQTVEHPIRTAENVAKTYKQTYGPLAHGDVSAFLHNLYSHPLGPILDAATLVTGGAGLAAKAGILSSDAATLALRSPAALTSVEGHVAERLTSHNPAIRLRERLTHDLMNKLPYETPHIGEAARYARATSRLPRVNAAALTRSPEARAYNKAVRNLDGAELAALHLIGNDIHPADLGAALKTIQADGGTVEPAMFKVLENPKVVAHFENPDAKMHAAIDAATALSQLDAKVKIEHGILTPEAAAARVGKHRGDVADILGTDAVSVPPYVSHGTEGVGSVPDRARENGFLYHRTSLEHLDSIRRDGLTPLKPTGDHPTGVYFANDPLQARGLSWKRNDNVYLRVARDKIHDLNDERAFGESLTPSAVPASKLEYLGADGAWYPLVGNKRIPGALRPTPGRPFYVPDVPAVRRVANSDFRPMGGGKSEPKNIVHANRGVLFRTGQLLLNHDLLSPTFLTTIKYGLADDLHASLMKGAARISREEAQAGRIPKGWAYVPKTVVSKTGRKRAQQIPATVRAKGDALRQTEHLFPADEQIANAFKVTDLKDAASLHGDYLIAPKSLIDSAVGNFTRSSGAVSQFLDKPFKVWRALVLGFRVGFLTNNVVGNHLLYAIHAAGPDGLRAYLNAVKRVHGESTVKSLLQMKGVPEPLRQQFMSEFFPDQVEGTFGRTQTPKFQSQKVKKLARASTGIAPATQAVAEGTVRRALVETYIRKSPEFRRVYKSTPDFEQAARQVLTGEKGAAYQAYISEKVNNALGDYLNMSKVEQDVLRQIMPFYSWYRAITRITIHLALDTPGRANILTKLGQVGATDTENRLGKLPDYLLGLIPFGARHGNNQNVISTAGVNPFNTVTQIGQGLAGLATGKPGDTGKAFSQLGPNPFLLGAIQNLSGKELFTGRTLKGHGGIVQQIALQTASQLPQAQLVAALLGHGRQSKLYGQQSGAEAVAQFLGGPVKKLNVPVANSYAGR